MSLKYQTLSLEADNKGRPRDLNKRRAYTSITTGETRGIVNTKRTSPNIFAYGKNIGTGGMLGLQTRGFTLGC